MNEFTLRKRLVNLGRFFGFPETDVEKRLTGLDGTSLQYLDNLSDEDYEAWLQERIPPAGEVDSQIMFEI